MELCLTAADKKDPQKLGPHFYKNGEPEEDAVGQQAFQERSVGLFVSLFQDMCMLKLVSFTKFNKMFRPPGCPAINASQIPCRSW